MYTKTRLMTKTIKVYIGFLHIIFHLLPNKMCRLLSVHFEKKTQK